MSSAIGRFLEQERVKAGWRFWLLWVAATNLGFFPGLALGNRLAASFGEPDASAIVGASFGALVGVLQGAVLRRHVARWLYWAAGTALGWGAGAGLGAWLLVSFAPNVVPGGAGWTIAIGFFAGAVVGVPQALELRRASRALGAWWVPISSLAWGVFFPGVVSGLVLTRRLSREPGAGCAGGSSCPTPRSGSG